MIRLFVSGLIVGAIIRYGSSGASVSSEFVQLPFNSSFGFDDPPDNLKLMIKNNESTQYFQYDYKAEMDENKVREKVLEDKVSNATIRYYINSNQDVVKNE